MKKPLRICLATQNQHKVGELLTLIHTLFPSLHGRLTLASLADLGIKDEPIEDGATFADNARIKARAAHRRTGLWSLADDSGLCVDALGGAPGIHSARYAGEPRSDVKNRFALLNALAGLPPAQRTAHFSCALCLYGSDEEGEFSILRSGRVEGTLRSEPRGEDGFGYDPLFVPTPLELHAAGLEAALCGRTFSELGSRHKNRLSHRSRALTALGPQLIALCDSSDATEAGATTLRTPPLRGLAFDILPGVEPDPLS